MGWSIIQGPFSPLSASGGTEPTGPHPGDKDAFLRLERQIAEEERRLRHLLEGQLREYTRLVAELASVFMGEELDARLRGDPEFCAHATPACWRELLAEALRRRSSAPVGKAEDGRWRTEEGGLRPPSSDLHPLPSIPLPAQPPAVFRELFSNWPREGLALALLGIYGFSLRYSLAELMAACLGHAQPNAGSVRRVFDHLARQGLWEEARAVLPGVYPDGRSSSLLLVRLTEQGKAVLHACGIRPVPGEWELLGERYQGDLYHIGLACAVAYQARRRGYETAPCQVKARSEEPDLLLSQGLPRGIISIPQGLPRGIGTIPQGQKRLYLCVGGGRGDPERWQARWRRQLELQGQVALATDRRETMDGLVAEARACGIAHGMATSLQELLGAENGNLWAVVW